MAFWLIGKMTTYFPIRKHIKIRLRKSLPINLFTRIIIHNNYFDSIGKIITKFCCLKFNNHI